MGVPKFFRWLSERYPKILQRIHTDDAILDHESSSSITTTLMNDKDPMGRCGLIPPIDHLYIDVNGILHGCAHNGLNYATDDATITHEQIFANVARYLDKIIRLTQPTTLIYLAIDGVAPRAKLNQQRTRRYRAGGEEDGDYGLGELSVYESYLQNHPSTLGQPNPSGQLQLVNGRLVGKVQEETPEPPPPNSKTFHSNTITPGTEFFQELVEFLNKHLVEELLPKWSNLVGSPDVQVILSGPNVPGEGEHKIMQFLREQRHYHPSRHNTRRHCVMGQDGDLILLGLATHDPNLLLLREKVIFKMDEQKKNLGPNAYVTNPCFEMLHFGVLRDYLALELETGNFSLADDNEVDDDDTSKWDLERTIDDTVFLSFFVGNDFLPHLPAMDIGDEGLDFLFAAYREERHNWRTDGHGDDPYLTHSGEIVSARRLERFLEVLGSHEHLYHDYKKSTVDMDKQREYEERYQQMLRTPSDDILHAKERDDRKRYREMLLAESSAKQLSPLFEGLDEKTGENSPGEAFEPVVSDERALSMRMSHLLELSVASDLSSDGGGIIVDDQDLKGRYYFDKFGFTPFDAEKHLALRRAYLEGLVWNLKYYYEGCVSWEWFYPYHYGPMMSDLVGLESILKDITFEIGRPLRPFEQLLACLPPSHAHLLPEPYRILFDDSSPIKDFYPRTFTVDMNGKRLPWEAVVLLPFIDSKRLIAAVLSVDDSSLTAEELERNEFGPVSVLSCKALIGSNPSVDGESQVPSIDVTPYAQSEWCSEDAHPREPPRFHPDVPKDVPIPLPGLSTLRDGSVASMWRKMIRINVHGSQSRYKTACLELNNSIPEIIPIETLASQLIGTVLYINYPHLLEALVTAVSDSRVIIRGTDRPRPWTQKEAMDRRARATRVISRYVFGEGLVGTGGLALAQQGGTPMEDLQVLLFVRPLRGLETTKSGQIVKRFATFEVEVPLFVTSWAPVNPDVRLQDIPVLLEKNPYHVAKFVLTDPSTRHVPARAKTFTPQSSVTSKAQGTSIRGNSGKNSLASSRGFASLTAPGLCNDFAPETPLPFRTQLFNESNLSKFGDVKSCRPAQRCSPLPGRQFITRPKVRPWARTVRRGGFVALGLLAAGSFFLAAVAEAASIAGSTDSFPSRSTMSASQASTSTPPLEFAHGTTTLAFTFQGGIVVAVDSRATMGNYIGSKTTHKVLPIHSHLIGTMAGGAADCSFWIRKLQAEARCYQQMEGGRRMSVARASRLLSNALYENRGLGLSLGTMICGIDEALDCSSSPATQKIFYVDNSGLRIESDMFAVGSGSTYALGILDTEQLRFDMTSEQAVALGIRAIRHATFRDAHSGGFINVYLITHEHGWQHVFSQDLALLS